MSVHIKIYLDISNELFSSLHCFKYSLQNTSTLMLISTCMSETIGFLEEVFGQLHAMIIIAHANKMLK